MQLPKTISLELAEEVGWHIGDGSMNFYKNRGKSRGFYQLRGHIEDDKKHYESRIKPLFKKLFGIKISIRDMPSTRVVGFQIWNDELVNFKKNLGLPLGYKYKIKIPETFLVNDKLKKAVVRGIFDTDGGIYLQRKNGKLYPRIYITTISFELSEQLLRLFKEIGLRVTRYSQLYNQKFNRKRSYILTIRGVEMFHKFMKEISPKNPKHIKKYGNFMNSQDL
ncbi:MAG: LAGLIDADG family homing endonuclease [Candidatus Pacearchaeota archaeon]